MGGSRCQDFSEQLKVAAAMVLRADNGIMELHLSILEMFGLRLPRCCRLLPLLTTHAAAVWMHGIMGRRFPD